MKQKLLSTFLVAAGLLAGTTGAWADTYEILYGVAQTDDDGNTTGVTNQTDFTGDANEKTDVTFTDANGDKCAAAMPIGGSVLYLKNAWTKDFSSPVTTGKVYFAGNYTVSATNSKTINIVDSKGNAIYSSSQQTTNGNANQVVAYICGTEISNYVRQARSAAYGVKSICIDLDAKTVTYDLLVSSGKNSYSEKTGTVNLPSDISDVKGLSMTSTLYDAYLDSVMFYSQVSDEKKYESTINYKLGDSIVASTSVNVVENTVLTAQNIVYGEDGVKYFSTESETHSFTVSATGTNSFDVSVRKAYTATLNVTTTIGGTSTVATTNLVEADDNTTNWSYAYSVYVNKDGVYYVADNTESFGETGTFTDGQTIDKTVTYSKVVSDVVYFREAESAVGSNTTLSGGADSYVAAQNYRNRGILVGELPAGTYQFAAVVTANNRRNLVVREYIATNGDAAGSGIFATLSYGTQSATFTLSGATSIVINGANSGDSKTNQSEDFDYVVIKKVATDATLSITSAGYATFAPAGNVTIPSDVTAYTVTVNDDNATITLSEISSDAVLPAGTGVLVAGAEGEYTFNGTTADATTLDKNDLKVAGASTVADGSQYGLGQMDGKVGFFKIRSGDTMAEGKAYLEVNDAAASKMSFFALDGELTGISAVGANEAVNGAFYTLQGVKTVKPSKGLYIYKGKKVIVK